MPKDFILYALFWRAFLFSSKSLSDFTAQQGNLIILIYEYSISLRHSTDNVTS